MQIRVEQSIGYLSLIHNFRSHENIFQLKKSITTN
jgi:hypothetical protein